MQSLGVDFRYNRNSLWWIPLFSICNIPHINISPFCFSKLKTFIDFEFCTSFVAYDTHTHSYIYFLLVCNMLIYTVVELSHSRSNQWCRLCTLYFVFYNCAAWKKLAFSMKSVNLLKMKIFDSSISYRDVIEVHISCVLQIKARFACIFFQIPFWNASTHTSDRLFQLLYCYYSPCSID